MIDKIFKKKEKQMTELIPYASYDEAQQYYLFGDGTITNFFQINPKDIYNLDDDERLLDNYKFEKFYKTHAGDIKIIALNIPEDTSEQQRYFTHKLEKCTNPIYRTRLDRYYKEVKYIEDNFFMREFFLQVFCETDEEYRKVYDRIHSILGVGIRGLISIINKEKKDYILEKLGNKNEKIKVYMPGECNFNKNKIDIELIKKIQPKGNIYFTDDAIRTGHGWESCIHVYKYKESFENNWFMDLLRLDNTIATIDLYTEDKGIIKQNINKSIGEQSSRMHHAESYDVYRDAEVRAQELQLLYDEVNTYGEVIKMMQLRIYVYAGTKEKLERRVEKIINELTEYSTAVFLNEQEEEFKSQYLPYTKQIAEHPFVFKGNPMTTNAIAGGNPFYASELRDPNGVYMGQTPSGGSVIFDEFIRTNTRLQYHTLLLGKMRSGKSTDCKKRFEYNAARNNFIRCFDVVGEFEPLTRELGGKIINPDGSEGVLNWLEIRYVSDNEKINYARHIAKIKAMYKSMQPDSTPEGISRFSEMLDIVYRKYNLNPETTKVNGVERQKQITKLPPAAYPTLSDMLQILDDEMHTIIHGSYQDAEKELMAQKLKDYDLLKTNLEELKNTYGAIFDGITTIDNIIDEQIVTFSLKTIKDMEENIFTAVLINLLLLCWDNCIVNGTIMKDMWESGKIKWEDIVRFQIIIDESHRWVNTSKPQVLDLLNIFMREAPKFFGALLFASHSITDFVPNVNGEGKDDNSAMNKLIKLFELTQYKVLFNQDSYAIPLLDKVFGNSLTASQKNRIPYLETGECILCIANEHNLEFKVFITEEEKQLYSGGA